MGCHPQEAGYRLPAQRPGGPRPELPAVTQLRGSVFPLAEVSQLTQTATPAIGGVDEL